MVIGLIVLGALLPIVGVSNILGLLLGLLRFILGVIKTVLELLLWFLGGVLLGWLLFRRK